MHNPFQPPSKSLLQLTLHSRYPPPSPPNPIHEAFVNAKCLSAIVCSRIFNAYHFALTSPLMCFFVSQKNSSQILDFPVNYAVQQNTAIHPYVYAITNHRPNMYRMMWSLICETFQG